MVLEGNIVDIIMCFGEVLINEKIYKFPLDIVYGDMINKNDRVKVRFENNIPKIITKYEILELEEYLDVD